MTRHVHTGTPKYIHPDATVLQALEDVREGSANDLPHDILVSEAEISADAELYSTGSMQSMQSMRSCSRAFRAAVAEAAVALRPKRTITARQLMQLPAAFSRATDLDLSLCLALTNDSLGALRYSEFRI